MARARHWLIVTLLSIAILGLIEAQFHVIRNLTGRGALSHRELATLFLARHIAAKYPGQTAVILSNPFTKQSGQPKEVYQYEKAGLRGLSEGLGKAVTIEEVVFPEIRPEFFKDRKSVQIDPSTSTPLSYLVREDALDRVAQAHPKAQIIVSLIGLPVNVTDSMPWKEGRKFALLLPDLRIIGDQAAVMNAFKSGRLTAVVANKPGAPSEDQLATRDPTIEFDSRFLLVTPENVERTLKAYPRLFQR